MHPTTPSSDEADLLDEIDIDSILSQSIGTTGKLEVPSAMEELPSLIEEDFIDVQNLLESLNQGHEENLASASSAYSSSNHEGDAQESDAGFVVSALGALPDVDETLRTPPNEVDPLLQELSELHEASPSSAATQENNVTIFLDETEQEEEASIGSDTSPQASLFATSLDSLLSRYHEEEKVKIDELLKTESTVVSVGQINIPPIPEALPASSTRKYRTRPKRKLKAYQFVALIQLCAIAVWFVFIGYSSWKKYKLAHMPVSPVQVPLLKIPPKIEKNKNTPPLQKPPPLKEIPPEKESKAPPIPLKAESPNTRADVLNLKGGSEEPQQIECNISMDSKNIREELKKCLDTAYQRP